MTYVVDLVGKEPRNDQSRGFRQSEGKREGEETNDDHVVRLSESPPGFKPFGRGSSISDLVGLHSLFSEKRWGRERELVSSLDCRRRADGSLDSSSSQGRALTEKE